jgi:hypothetical protein
MENPMNRVNLRWILVVLAVALVATGVGFLAGMWLGS